MAQIDGADVVVVGAGVTGLASAWFLARAGVDVLVVDKGVVGYEASSRNGGICAYHRGVDPKGLMGYEETRLWHNLEEELGYPCEFSLGNIHVAMNEEDWAHHQTRIERLNGLGWRIEPLDAQQVKELVPIINPGVAGADWDPDAGHANPQRTVQAFSWAIQDHGGRILQNTLVTGFKTAGDRVTAVETPDGDIACQWVVLASGPQTGRLADIAGAFVPIAPGRAEIVVSAPVPMMKYGAIMGNGLYGRQTLRGNLAYGGGNDEWVDVDLTTPEKPNTPLIRNIGRRLNEMFSGAGDIPMIRSWACVVEQTPDWTPIIDTLENPENVVFANASGDGFGLYPAHGKAVSQLIMHGESTLPLEGYRLDRFKDTPRDWREQLGRAAPPEAE